MLNASSQYFAVLVDETAQNLAVFVVLGFFFSIYMLAGGTVFLILSNGLKQNFENTLWKKIVGLPFLPAFVVWGLLLCCLSIPLYWLYPEKHLTQIDFDGTDEQKQKLKDYRSTCAKKGLLRRFIENIGLAQRTGPPWPSEDDGANNCTDR